ncbi:Chain A, Active Ribosome Inactivating Protein [Artemisia annua]|uniref:rRNA N-glycosylase n=1 Tax=Artemisia annua TaxID=35608 RepID=A0A2U1P6W4_ARTAN|nr:Chain A, Active Ribosome Inactivating Protein [Artemisia annua]
MTRCVTKPENTCGYNQLVTNQVLRVFKFGLLFHFGNGEGRILHFKVGECELSVEDGLAYKDSIVYFVGEVLKDRSPGKLFRLKAVNPKGAVIFYIRYDNLYLVGFEIVGGKTYEFGREGDTHLIKNSTFLQYDGSYREMGEDLLVNIRTDYWALIEAVNKLLEGKDRKDTANWMNGIKKYLATAVVMFPESARFRWVFVTLVRLMNLGQICPPTCVKPWMPKMIRSWEDMTKVAAGSLIKVPVETVNRKRKKGTWWVTVKLADAAGNEEFTYQEWSSLKEKFPDYDDGHAYN